MTNRKLLYYSAFLLLAVMACSSSKKDVAGISFPYSQWTVGLGNHQLAWQYQDMAFNYNNSFIERPDSANWETWHQQIKDYRQLVCNKIGKEAPLICWHLPDEKPAKIHFDKIGYDLKIQNKENITVSGEIKSPAVTLKLYIDFDLKTEGEELSYVVRKQLNDIDSLELSPGKDWQAFSLNFDVPEFMVDSFSTTPILRIVAVDETYNGNVYMRNIQLQVPKNDSRQALLAKIERHIEAQAANNALKIPEELSWSHQNFVMGFAFIWDQDFWNPEKGCYTVDHYCKKMQKEFGGFQSVILWHSYPNIGIDEKNQFDFFEAMPGGLDSLKKIVSDFHQHGIKVFITYNPWDLDTRRPPAHDNQMLAKIVATCDLDGIYLDTWCSSTGVISNFSVDRFMREAVAEYGRQVAFSTEIFPEYKDLIGYNALTCSWGQEIHPQHYTDLSHIKWLMPEHKQHYINRGKKDRKRELCHAWINGQGITVWENLFGSMNLWHARDRQVLRKMNAIWKAYGSFYLTDNWKPFVPTGNDKVLASIWEQNGQRLWHFVCPDSGAHTVRIAVNPDKHYYNLWNGKQLKAEGANGKLYVQVEVQDFSCLLEAVRGDETLNSLLAKQATETAKVLPSAENDKHAQEQSLKTTIDYVYDYSQQTANTPDLPMLDVEGGTYTLESKHIWREGECYPNMDAKGNHDLVIVTEEGAKQVVHHHEFSVSAYHIMPRVVTNAQFDAFLKATNYKPRFSENFLKHWNGESCPENIKDDPVVYVSLEDARIYAQWAGMRLPSEWEWQLAIQQHPEKFQFNEVFEWNESERNDGFNRFVNLRGGCSRWILPSSWWYLPSAPYGQPAGGAQAYNSHCKYFLMYPGLDRASTIGFRCMKKP